MSFLNRHRYLLAGILCLFGMCLMNGQDRKTNTKAPDSKNTVAVAQKKNGIPEKKKTRVDLLYADEAQADKLLRPDVQVLIGSVRLKHDSMYMFCDSALIYEKSIRLKLLVMFVWSRGILCLFTVIICTMTECRNWQCCVSMCV